MPSISFSSLSFSPLELGALIAASGFGAALKLRQWVRAEPSRQTPSGVFSGYLNAVFGSMFMHVVLGNFFRGGKLPATSVTVSTQPRVHGITGVCIPSTVLRVVIVIPSMAP